MSAAAAIERKDRRRVMITPEGIALSVVLASRGTRFGALMLDLLFMSIALTLVTIVLGFTGLGLAGDAFGKGKDPASAQALMAVMVFYILLLFAFRYGYFLLFELGPRGATPGKRMTGIRIAARSGGRLTPEMVLARNLLRDIEVFLPLGALFTMQNDGPVGLAAAAWLMLFALFPFFNRNRLRAGDVIAGTWVIEAPRHRLLPAMSTTAAATSNTSRATGATYRFSEAELAIYGEYELQTLERVLREDRAEAMAAVHEAICRKIGWFPGGGDERAFLEAYYTQLRGRLEAGMRMGKRKADKHT